METMERSNWKQVFSKSKQRYYWFNEASGQTQWTEPPAVSAANGTTGTTIGTTGTGTTGTSTGTGTKSDEGSTSDDNKKRKRDDVILTTTSGSSSGSSSDPSSSNDHPRAAPRAYTLPKVAIIVPFRDLHHEQKRAEHLARFIPEMARFLSLGKNDFQIYIVEQSNDGRKFNRGKLLNIGFDLACKEGCNIFVFHDVDLIPSDDLLTTYTTNPDSSGAIHIARVWERYSKNPEYFGGIVSFSESQFRRINGFPNNFWGWGGEDDEMKRRVTAVGLPTTHPTHGSIEDMENMSLVDKLSFLKKHKDWKCMMKWELEADHASTWKTNGLANLDYVVCRRNEIAEKRCSIVTVDVKLNNHPMTDSKCGL